MIDAKALRKTLRLPAPSSTTSERTPTNPFATAAPATKPVLRHGLGALVREVNAIDDPEGRERTRREWGLVGLDEHGNSAPARYGRAFDAAVNAAIAGRNTEELWSGDPRAIASERSRSAEAARKARYLNGSDARKLNDAASYAVQLRGRFFNSQITLVYRDLGETDVDASTGLLSDYFRECRAYLKGRRAEFDFIYNHEHSDERGFHTHVVTYIPVHLRDDIRGWTRKFFLRRYQSMQDNAVLVQVSGSKDGLALHKHRLQYLCKGIDPQIIVRAEDGSRRPLIDVLEIPAKLRRPAGVVGSIQRCGCSHSIGEAARRADGRFISVFATKSWSRLYSGWEMDEFVRRVHEDERDRTLAAIAKKL